MKKAYDFLDSATVFSKPTANVTRPFSELMKTVSASITASLKPLENSLQKLGEDIGKSLHQFGINERVAAKLLKDYKLFLSPSMDIRLVSELAKIGRKPGLRTREINRLLIRYLMGNDFEELERMMRLWDGNKLFRPRMRILRDCLAALRNHEVGFNASNVILPALIAQIDGIRQCFLESKGYRYVKTISKKGRTSYNWMDPQGRIVKWKNIYRNASATRYMAEACAIFLDLLFGNSERGAPAIYCFNRHKIMHGESLRYGRIDYTIRALLILDFLYYLK